ncbi:MAG TPA: ATP-binding cassette domain-containing protein, partial [Candidatus Limnocylindria bacterium]|nr:ATP-binding cassette domain-containing protein [Candidatus Limnocylindria bacterium]
MAEAILHVRNLTKHFDGLAAVENISLEVHRREIHAVIGPNGAGKSTLINLLAGELRASAGEINFQGRDISSLASEKRSRIGIGRSFQKTNIFPSFTALENCRLAAQSREPRPWRWLRDAQSYQSIMSKAHQA